MSAHTSSALVLVIASLLACTPAIALADSDIRVVDCSSGASITGAVRIVGARRVVIANLTITNPVGDGVFITDGASATLRRNEINDSSGYGIFVRNASFAMVNDNHVLRNGVVNNTNIDASGIAVAQGSMVRAARNQIGDNFNSGVEVFDNSTFRSEGDTMAMRTAAPAGRSAVDTYRAGLVDLRGVTVTGSVFVNQQSQLQARNLEGPTGTSTFTGNFDVSTLAFLRLRAGVVRSASTMNCFTSGFSICRCDGFPGSVCPTVVP